MAYTIQQFVNLSSTRRPAFSPDGRHLAFITNRSGLPQVWEMDLGGSDVGGQVPRQRTFGVDRIGDVSYSPSLSNPALLYSRDAGGNENMQLFSQPPAGGSEVNLTAGYESAMHLAGCWMPGGEAILVAANRRLPAIFDLYLQPLEGPARLIWENGSPGFPVAVDVTGDGRRALVRVLESGSKDRLLEIDLLSGSARDLVPGVESARWMPAGYAADGNTIYVATDLGADFVFLACLDLDSLAMKRLIQHPWDVEHLKLSPDRRLLAYALNRDGISDLRLYDLGTGEGVAAPQPGAGPGVISPLDWDLAFAPDSRSVAFSYATPIAGSDIFVWHLDAGRVEQRTHLSTGEVRAADLVRPELVRYTSFDDLEIPAWYFRPRKAYTPHPVIVYVHGGPESQFRPNFFVELQYLLQRGYAVLAPNVRGSTGYGKAYSHLDDVERRLDSVQDLAAAASWLAQLPEVDAGRLAIYGRSYGGFMVLAALVEFPALWAAGIDVVGISNFVSFLENTSGYRRSHREKEYGSLAHDRAFLDQISPLHKADRIQAPLLVIHGVNDPRVPLSEAEQLVAALQDRDVPVEFLVFDDEGHSIVRRENLLVAYPTMLAFLEEHLR